MDKNSIVELIKTGKTQRAFDSLLGLAIPASKMHNDLLVLNSEYSLNEEKELYKSLSKENADIERNRINQCLLKIIRNFFESSSNDKQTSEHTDTIFYKNIPLTYYVIEEKIMENKHLLINSIEHKIYNNSSLLYMFCDEKIMQITEITNLLKQLPLPNHSNFISTLQKCIKQNALVTEGVISVFGNTAKESLSHSAESIDARLSDIANKLIALPAAQYPSLRREAMLIGSQLITLLVEFKQIRNELDNFVKAN